MLVRKAHERGGKALWPRVLPRGEHGENHGVIARGHVTEVLVVKLGRMGCLVAAPGDERGDYCRHGDGKADARDPVHCRARCRTARVCVIGVLLLLGENGAELLARGLGALGNPACRERDARLGKLARANARDGVDDVVPVERKARVEGTVSPGAYVVPTHNGLAARHRQMDGAGDVLRLDVPTVRDELPVQLARVRPTRGEAVGIVRDIEVRRRVALGRVELDLQVGAIVCNGVGLVCTRRGLGEGPGLATLHDTGVKNLDAHRATVGAVLPLGNLPVHAMEVSVEVKGAHLGHGKAARRIQRCVDVCLVHAVVVRPRRRGAKGESYEQGQQRKDDEQGPVTPLRTNGVPVSHRIPQCMVVEDHVASLSQNTRAQVTPQPIRE